MVTGNDEGLHFFSAEVYIKLQAISIGTSDFVLEVNLVSKAAINGSDG